MADKTKNPKRQAPVDEEAHSTLTLLLNHKTIYNHPDRQTPTPRLYIDFIREFTLARDRGTNLSRDDCLRFLIRPIYIIEGPSCTHARYRPLDQCCPVCTIRMLLNFIDAVTSAWMKVGGPQELKIPTCNTNAEVEGAGRLCCPVPLADLIRNWYALSDLYRYARLELGETVLQFECDATEDEGRDRETSDFRVAEEFSARRA
ncbi:hypothetical protein BCR34DRAFT_603048 [Clohesyomyces aquaticus]|uniref:Uncharacterized protein n=1 Tax=Clohesyomyces aquaticus TaxID=1231657 RepID=A0A1Y1ZFW1_9PLEO|nr:hypothetical protein BCR34DRAFT_603048 [Clohesyomyces aquaticus]